MRERCLRIGILAALSLTGCAFATDQQWSNLEHIDHCIAYRFYQKDGSYLAGTISSLSRDAVVVDSFQPANASGLHTLRRDDVLQVKDGCNSYDVLYSGRSSWADVEAVGQHRHEYLELTLKSGASFRGRPLGSSASEITLQGAFRKRVIAKRDVASAVYIRLKPASERLQWVGQEGGVIALLFDYKAWPWVFNVNDHIAVVLYNAALPEDNSSIPCPTGSGQR